MPRKRPPAGGGDFPPVGYLNDQAGFSAPQYVPSSPQRLPPPNQRLRWPVNTLISDGDDVVSPGGIVSPPTPVLPPVGPVSYVSDPFHYASVKALYIAVPLVGLAVPFLQQSDSRRNLLSLRNDSAAAIIYISFGTPANNQAPFALTAGQTILFDNAVPQDDVYCSASAAAAFLAYGWSNIPV